LAFDIGIWGYLGRREGREKGRGKKKGRKGKKKEARSARPTIFLADCNA